jgi:hypothetical protein
MLRTSLWMVVFMIGAALPLAAGSLDGAFGFERTGRALHMFESSALQGQLLDDSGPSSADQRFGAGVALSFNNSAAGIGVNGYLDYYFTTWISASAHSGVSYGALGRRFERGGTAFHHHFALGAKFTFDMERWEWSSWLRPWVAAYPIGFQYFDATEDIRRSDGRREKFRYSDVFFYQSIGGGVDFFLTSNVAIGASILFYGSWGGSRHERHGVVIRTRGLSGAHFEYARVGFRF